MIEEYHNFLDNGEADLYIRLIDDHLTEVNSIKNYRSTGLSILKNSPIRVRIADHFSVPISRIEDVQGQRYVEGGFFDEHYDSFTDEQLPIVGGHSGHRIISNVIYLNDDFVGGQTEFTDIDKVIQPERGKLVTWSNIINGELDDTKIHRGTPVVEGTKYILTIFIRENDFDLSKDFLLANEYVRNQFKRNILI